MTVTASSATGSLIRQFARYLGVAFILSFIGLFGAIADAPDVVPLWWTVAAVVAIHGMGLVLFATSFRRPGITAVVWSGQVLCIGYGLVIATWPLVWNGGLVDAGYGMWFTQFNGFAAATAPLIWRVRWSLPYLIYAVVSVQFVNAAVRTTEFSPGVLTDIAWGFCLCVMPYAFVVTAVRSVRVLDATRAQSAHAAADAAATVARAEERARFDGLTHDRVMATLLAAARTPMSDELMTQAGNTLTKLDVLWTDADSERPAMNAETAIGEISRIVRTMDAGITVNAEITADEQMRYPGAVVSTVTDAAAEAVRNSVLHAGPEANRSVEVIAADGHLSVRVVDNGVGFDPSAVRPDRLGVAGSIRGRMQHLDGGSADITTGDGQGTSIQLQWSRP